MHRVISTLFQLSSIVIAGSACSPFANGGDTGLIVLDDEGVAAGGTCSFTATGTEPTQSFGTINADSPKLGYLLHPLLQSKITAAGSGSNGLTTVGTNDQRIIETAGARIDIDFGGSTLFTTSDLDAMASQGLTHNETPFSTPVGPDGFSATLFEIVSVPLLKSIGTALRAAGDQSVVVETTSVVYGYEDGDTDAEIDSQPFKFPVTVCIDCISTVEPIPECTGAAITTGSGTDPCNPYQDGSAPCCTVGGVLICPGG